MHKINRVTNSRNKILLKIIIVFTVLFVNLILLKPSFSQANVEYYNLSGDTSTRGAISIAFPEGWSTYWKFPGPNGFIPKIRVLTEKNLESFSISWPYPKKLGPKNFTYLGYDDDLLLPIEIKKLDKRKKIHLHLDISFGICKSVCVVQNKTLEISDEGDLNYLVLDKLLKSKNRITMTTSFGNSNKFLGNVHEQLLDMSRKNDRKCPGNFPERFPEMAWKFHEKPGKTIKNKKYNYI